MQSTSTEVFPSSDVAVFWDYENCHATSSVSGYQVVSGIRNVAHKYGSVKSFKAYMEVPDANSFSRALSLRSELQSSGVSVTDCPHNGRKDVADQMIMVDMLTYAINHPPPATILLISGDRDFAYAAAVLRLRRYKVVVISILAHSSLKSQASVWLDWNTHVLGYTNSSPRSGCVEPLSSSTSTVQQTPITCKESYLGESSHTGSKFERTKLSPVRSVSEHPVSQGQSKSIYAPTPVYATNIPTPRPNIVDPPRDTGPLNPLPSRSAPEAEPEQVSLASPVRLFSETSLPPENNIPSQPLSSPAALDRASSLNLDSRHVTDSTHLFTSLHHVQSLDHDVPVTILSSSPPPTGHSSIDGYETAPMTTPMASPLIGVSTAAEIHNLSQEVFDASRSAVPVTSPNIFARAEHSPNFIATLTGPSAAPPLSSSSTPTPNLTFPNLAFQLLIAVLEKHHANGVMHPLRSVVGEELFAHSKTVYKDTGAQSFSQLTALAETAGIIQRGGSGGKEWISLRTANFLSAPHLTFAVTPAGVGGSTLAGANVSGNKVPATFRPLVDVLLKHSAAGVTRPLRTDIGAELSKAVYHQAGVKRFKQFATLAEKAKLIETGGKGSSAWVSLHRDLIIG